MLSRCLFKLRGSSEVVGVDRLTSLDLSRGHLHMLDCKVVEEPRVNRGLRCLVHIGAALPISRLHRSHELSLRSARPALSNVDANIVGRLLKSRLAVLDLSRNKIGAGGTTMLAWGLKEANAHAQSGAELDWAAWHRAAGRSAGLQHYATVA